MNPLANLAFEDPARAERLWARLQGEEPQRSLFEPFAPTLLQALSESPEPDRLLLNFERWVEGLGTTLTYYRLFAESPRILEPLLRLMGLSQYMADTILQNPELSELLLDPRLLRQRRTRAQLQRDLNRLLQPCTNHLMRLDRLRLFKQQELLRITALEVLGKMDLRRVVESLSDLADVCVESALAICHTELSQSLEMQGEPSLCVLAMGKWGARELNYSSDIDLVFLCADMPNLTGKREPIAYLQRLCEALVKALSEPMKRGIVFRVDLRLRPEGRHGPIVRTLQSALHYYENWAEVWERQAMMKARPCAGDLRVGETLLERLRPWVYRPQLSEDDFSEIVQQRIRTEAQTRARNEWETDIKNGWGGIRDIEFPVQALQLMYGGRMPRLRTPSTLNALKQLRQARLIEPETADALTNAYIFLRTVEHRLQLLYGHQTHSLPKEPNERAKFARRMGYTDLEPFERDLQHHRSVARAFREQVLSTETTPPAPPDPMPIELIGTEEGKSEWERRLGALGFREPARAYQVLTNWVVGNRYGEPVPEERRSAMRILPELLTTCARTLSPDRALIAIEQLADALPSRAMLFRSFEVSREVPQRLAELAQSPPLWNTLMANLELLDMLFGEEISAYGAKTREEHRRALWGRLEGCRTVRAMVGNLRTYARRERLRIGARDLWGETTPLHTASDLSALASELLTATLWVAGRMLQEEKQETPPEILLLGFGSLGAGEVGYTSDWDIAFVCVDEASLQIAQEQAVRMLNLCQQMSEQGAFPKVDTRLRPEGGSGALVRTLDGVLQYYAQYAEPWERLALMRVQVLNETLTHPSPPSPEASGEGGRTAPLSHSVGEGQGVRAEFLAHLNAYRYRGAPSEEEANAIRHLVHRTLTERIPPNQQNSHLKLGKGGLAVIEFLVGWLTLHTATPESYPHSSNTLEVLDWLLRQGAIDRPDHEVLSEAWQLQYHLRNRLALLFEPAPEVLPEGDRFALLASSLGYERADELWEHLQNLRQGVDEIARRHRLLS